MIFLAYHIVIWYFYTLQNDHQCKSSYCSPPCKAVTVLRTLCPMLSLHSHDICFITKFETWGGNLFHLLNSSPTSLRLWQPPAYSWNLWVNFCFVVLFCFVDSIYKWHHKVFLFLCWHISLSIIWVASISWLLSIKFHKHWDVYIFLN